MFIKMINELKINNTNIDRFSKIINPFSLYYLCDHYIGDEIKQYNLPVYNKNNILLNKDLSIIKDFDIIHVQVNYFNIFYKDILCKINKKIILTTGQWHLPQIKNCKETDEILNNPNIILWISQNPIYQNNSKYIAFPYGIAYDKLENYSHALLKYNNIKNKDIINLPINNNTNICRKKLPFLKNININEFYFKIAESKFVISPIGDRDDCYRHYEAIGLGTIPISNVNNLYKNIFEENMYYCNIDEMVNIINTNSINYKYNEPNKDLICFDYYKEKIMMKINQLKTINI